MSLVTFVLGFVVGVLAAAIYNYFLGAKFTKFSAQVMREIESLKGKK